MASPTVIKPSVRVDTDPISGLVAVTPNDSTDLAKTTRAVYIGTAGDLKVDMADGTTGTFNSAEGLLPIAVTRIYSTGTAAQDILALY